MRKNFWNFVFSPLFVLFVVFPNAFAALSDFDRQEISFENLLGKYNGGFESGKANWTTSGGTFTAVTSGTNLLIGKGSVTWDASASGQTLSSQLVTIPKGLYGRNCEANILAQVPSGTATHYVEAYDGTNVLGFATIKSTTTPSENPVTFPCPTSGSFRLRVYANADEPLAAFDLGYLGLARNVGVADLTTEWTSFTPTGSWAGTTSYAGRWRQVGDTRFFQVKVTPGSGPTGSALTITISSVCTIDTNKLASGTGEAELPNSGGSLLDNGSYFGLAKAFYASTTTVGLRATSLANPHSLGQITPTSPVTWTTGDTIDVSFSAPCVGLAASQTIMPDAQGLSWSGYHAATCIWTTTSTSYADPSDDASCTLSERTNRNFGTVVTYGAAKPGITFTPRKSGTYFVCARSALYNSTVNGYSTMALNTTGGTTATIGTGGIRQGTSSGSNDEKSVTLCGLVNLTSATSTTVRLQIAASTGTTTLADLSSGGTSVEWSIFNVDQPVQAILANSVISNVTNGIRIEGASIDNTGTATIVRQTGSWINSVSRTSAGVVEINYSSSLWSVAPICTLTINAGTLIARVESITTTKLTTRMITSAGTSTDNPFYVHCIGPR